MQGATDREYGTVRRLLEGEMYDASEGCAEYRRDRCNVPSKGRVQITAFYGASSNPAKLIYSHSGSLKPESILTFRHLKIQKLSSTRKHLKQGEGHAGDSLTAEQPRSGDIASFYGS